MQSLHKLNIPRPFCSQAISSSRKQMSLLSINCLECWNDQHARGEEVTGQEGQSSSVWTNPNSVMIDSVEGVKIIHLIDPFHCPLIISKCNCRVWVYNLTAPLWRLEWLRDNWSAHPRPLTSNSGQLIAPLLERFPDKTSQFSAQTESNHVHGVQVGVVL